MRLTARARNAVAAMADLAANGGAGPVALRDIAERQRLPLPFLEQIFAQLRRAGLVDSRRGAAGGYALTAPGAAVSVAAIVRAVDEEIRTTACVPSEGVSCRGTQARCLTHSLWHDLDCLIEAYLERVTVADVLAGASAAK